MSVQTFVRVLVESFSVAILKLFAPVRSSSRFVANDIAFAELGV